MANKRYYILSSFSYDGKEYRFKITNDKEELLSAAKTLLSAIRPFFPIKRGRVGLYKEQVKAIKNLESKLDELGIVPDYHVLPTRHEFQKDGTTLVYFSVSGLLVDVLKDEGTFLFNGYSEELAREEQQIQKEIYNFAVSLGEGWFK
ncbi:hypothetical protein [Thermus phage P23-45]|uniref:Uncharacterized protein n=1 Tax=Thermus virus P23-45 TaxID=2914006 RepID=A7XX37_BP234|nr:hypothetical protein P23p16 [Thermus phage P23-45]ABU96849.1 hypothetical protein P23p16 [Thermus phage P23-45]UYB98458.1 hypothetical protein [Thermus phage P23-45]